MKIKIGDKIIIKPDPYLTDRPWYIEALSKQPFTVKKFLHSNTTCIVEENLYGWETHRIILYTSLDEDLFTL